MSTTEQDLRERFGLTDFEQDLLDQDAKNRLEFGNQNLPDPERSARVLNVAGRTGIPHEVIDSGKSLEDLEAKIDQDDFNPQEWMDTAPEMMRFAARNPWAQSVVKRDVEALSWFEREWMRPWQLSIMSTQAQVELNMIQDRRAQGREHWLDSDEKKIDILQGQIQQHDFGATNIAKPLVWLGRNIGPMASVAYAGVDEAMVGATAGASVGGMTAGPPGMAAGFFSMGGVGWSLGSAEQSFRMMRGEQYGRYIEAGFSHEEAARVANVTGAISAVPELTGVGKLIRHIPGVDNFATWGSEKLAAKVAGDVLAKPTFRQAGARLARRYGSNMAWEISTEIIQDSVATVGQNYLADAEGMPDARVDYEQWKDDMVDTAVETAKGVMLLSATGPGMAYVQDHQRAKRSREMEQVFRSLAESITDSKMRTEAPADYRKFVEQVTERNGEILINANRWDEFWQGQNEDPNAMAKRFGMDADKLDLARTGGHDVSIPPVAFAEQLAPSKLFDPILQDLKFHENDMSPRERDHFDKNKPQIIQDIEANLEKALEAENEVDADAIMAEVGTQLIEAQYAETEAAHLAQLYRGFGVIADKLDMDPTQLFEKFFGGVRRMTPEAISRSEILDPDIDPTLNRLRRDDFPTTRQTRGASLMDMIDELGGIDPMDPELSARDFELGAMDLGISRAKMDRWKEGGQSLSDIAEIASEQGYIPSYDENILLEALDRELGGEPVFGTRDTGSQQFRDIQSDMEQLGEIMDQLGLNYREMSNEDIRNALEAADTYDQDMTGKELRMMIQHLNNATERVAINMNTQASEVDTMLATAEMLMPLVYQDQDFGDIQLTDTVVIEDGERAGEIAETTEDAQVKFERAQKRKKALKALVDCLSG